METSILNVLIIDNDKHSLTAIKEIIDASGMYALVAETAQQGLNILEEEEIGFLILNVNLQDRNGLDVVKEIVILYPKLNIIVTSDRTHSETIDQAIRLGAFGYLMKPLMQIDIQIAIERIKKNRDYQQKFKYQGMAHPVNSKNTGGKTYRQFIGNSPQARDVLNKAVIASKYPDINVLITGEYGTGKENIARIIHFLSLQKENTFLAVNCSTLSDVILDSLFSGFEKKRRSGTEESARIEFEICDNSTLFLDEISGMLPGIQFRFMRAIENQIIIREENISMISPRFRIISTTNRDPDQLAEEKIFRIDLLKKLDSIHIHIPPLRERKEDIAPLCIHFIERFAAKFNKSAPQISPETIQLLLTYDFPGNVRELKNMTEQAMILCKGNTLTVNDFPIEPKSITAIHRSTSSSILEERERELIQAALQNCGFNKKTAAEALGISKDTLIRKIKKYRISTPLNKAP